MRSILQQRRLLTANIFFLAIMLTIAGGLSAQPTNNREVTTVAHPSSPNPPVSGGDVFVCKNVTVPPITATVGSGETVDWYATATGGLPLQSNTLSYNTGKTAPGTYTYFAEARNTTTGLVSVTRTPVSLTIQAAAISSTTSSAYTACTNDSITLTANGVKGKNPVVTWHTEPKGRGFYVGTGLSIKTNSGSRTYYAMVTTDCGDTAEAVAIISQKLAATYTITNILCNGAATGSITTIRESGGTSPYQVSVNPANGYANVSAITGLKATTYRLYLQDANGCTGFTDVIPILQPAKITPTFTKTDVSCFGGANGAIAVNATGGVGPYAYRLNTTGAYGSATTFIGLKKSNNRVYVQDHNLCVVPSVIIAINQPAAALSATATATVACFGTATGSITALATGGTAPYQFSVNPTTGFSNANTIRNLHAGNYRVYVKDSNGCTSFTPVVTVSAAGTSQLAVSFSKTDPTCSDASDGTITLMATGGTGSGYEYKLGGRAYQAIDSFTGLHASNYRGYVRQAATGCEVFTPVIQLIDPNNTCKPDKIKRLTSVAETIKTVQLYPNPSAGLFALQLSGMKPGKAIVTISSENGWTIEQRTVSIPASTAKVMVQYNFADQPNGVYWVKVITAEGVTVSRMILSGK